MPSTARIAALVILGTALTGGVAWADACNGGDRTGGTILGAIAGGVLGGAVFNGNRGTVASGVLLAGFADNAIARDMDCEDRPYAARSYNQSFHGPVGRRYGWNRGPNRGYIVSNREYHRYGQLCRDFTQVVYRRGRQFDREGTACLRTDGAWELV